MRPEGHLKVVLETKVGQKESVSGNTCHGITVTDNSTDHILIWILLLSRAALRLHKCIKCGPLGALYLEGCKGHLEVAVWPSRNV